MLNEEVPEFIKQITAEKSPDIKDLAITVLVDHSGSLLNNGGTGSVILRLALDTLASIFCGLEIKHEILGFTTNTWLGGDSWKKWKKRWIYRRPGRVCDLLHIIYRTHDDEFSGPSPHFSNLFRRDLLKENIDGEAIAWAEDRLRRRSETRKVLIYIADGAPVDDATLQANSVNFLHDHCAEVIKSINTEGSIEIFGVGINYHLAPMLNNEIFLNKAEYVSEAIFEFVQESFIRRR